MNLDSIQRELRAAGLDGWLFFELGCGRFCKTQKGPPCNTRPGAPFRMWPTWTHKCNCGEKQ
jgi:hypothetical protein